MSQQTAGGRKPSPIRRPGKIRASIISAWIAGGLAAAGVVIAAVIALLGHPTVVNVNIGSARSSPSSASQATSSDAPSLVPAMRASISLKPGSVVPECALISGHTTGIPATRRLWIFIQVRKQNSNDPAQTYYPLGRPLRLNADGSWSADVKLGDNGEDASPFWLNLVTSAPFITKLDSTDSLTTFPPGFDSHPLATVLVLRGISNAPARQCNSYPRVSS